MPRIDGLKATSTVDSTGLQFLLPCYLIIGHQSVQGLFSNTPLGVLLGIGECLHNKLIPYKHSSTKPEEEVSKYTPSDSF